MPTSDVQQITVRLKTSLHREVKSLAALNGDSIQSICEEALSSYLKKGRKTSTHTVAGAHRSKENVE